jgi:hypothetical protein
MPTLNLSLDDLVPFADLGTTVEATAGGFVLKRNGVRTEVVVHGDGYAVRGAEEPDQIWADAGLVLASPRFGDLARIAQNQAVVLGSVRLEGTPVPITSVLKQVAGSVPEFVLQDEPWKALDQWLRGLRRTQSDEGTDLLLIDGPAGVGKTTIVREAALLRAEIYDGSLPLILQIVSRGRVLQNIADLIAFALQDVRANLTISELIVLIRHGLITLAIDGFDELSDPNGFQTAWSGLNSLIEGARGSATILLAGRETFVSTETIRRQLVSFRSTEDRLSALSLSDPDPMAARDWLLSRPGWDAALLSMDFVEPIFVKDSYALRPFFLEVIGREPDALRDNEPPASDLLSYLVDVMTRREATKFVESLDPPNGNDAIRVYGAYVGRFLEEVARDLAENQSDSIAEDALDLLATVAANGLLPDDQIAAVVQRARTIVFLANDVQPGHARFAHEQIQQHFLSREALRSVGEGETPRYVRRNLFGRESLEVFGHVARGRSDEAQLFLRAVRRGISAPSRDRTATNLSALGIAAACGAAPDNADLRIRDVWLNELHFPFSPPPGISIQDTVISVLRVAGVDLRNVEFRNGVDVATLEIDRQTLLPPSLPMPQLVETQKGTIADQREIERILKPGTAAVADAGIVWSAGLTELLGRVERYRPFWLRTNIEDTDPQGRRIISHDDWPALYAALKELDYVTIRSRQAAGVRADFVHFRQDVRLSENADLHARL